MAPCLYLVVPCYNEQAVLPETAPLFAVKINQLISEGRISPESRVLFVDDGSTDETWNIISNLSSQAVFTGISLSKNEGHQNALLAGLFEAKDNCDITVSIDCDGQDDINAIDNMLTEYEKGSEIVYGVRDSRRTDSFVKRSSARLFYRIMRFMGAKTVYDHADYRLVSSKVLNAFERFEEVNLYLRGMFPIVGFTSSCVTYDRKQRVAGKSHYSVSKMFRLALDGITGFSVRPLRLITLFGLFISFVSLGLIVYTLVQYFRDNVVAGWASTMITVSFIGGIQMISLGVLGEYIGKIYTEVKHRPRYTVAKKTDDREQKKDV